MILETEENTVMMMACDNKGSTVRGINCNKWGEGGADLSRWDKTTELLSDWMCCWCGNESRLEVWWRRTGKGEE